MFIFGNFIVVRAKCGLFYQTMGLIRCRTKNICILCFDFFCFLLKCSEIGDVICSLVRSFLWSFRSFLHLFNYRFVIPSSSPWFFHIVLFALCLIFIILRLFSSFPDHRTEKNKRNFVFLSLHHTYKVHCCYTSWNKVNVNMTYCL
jgi:hypothetical protein